MKNFYQIVEVERVAMYSAGGTFLAANTYACVDVDAIDSYLIDLRYEEDEDCMVMTILLRSGAYLLVYMNEKVYESMSDDFAAIARGEKPQGI